MIFVGIMLVVIWLTLVNIDSNVVEFYNRLVPYLEEMRKKWK